MTEIKNAKQVSDVVWEIPTSFKEGMNVPARIYATRKLLEEMDNGVIEQVTNVAMLPGIVRYSYAMADAHWGYGFPIGGVAAFDTERGVISPGGIGFDINCLHPDSKVYDENGIWRRIGSEAPPISFTSYDESSHSMLPTKAVMRQQRWEGESILKLSTKLGKTLLVTADHPVRTRRGMVLAGKLSMEDSLLVSGVEGIPFTEPLPIELVSLDSLNVTMERMGISDRGNSRAQVLEALRSRGLDRLKLNDPRMAQLTKLLGFAFGDGNIPRVKKGQYVTLWGKAVDLEGIKQDLMGLGFGSHGFTRERHHKIDTFYGTSEFDFIEESLQISSTAFAVLMVALGAPYGKKTNQAYRLPEWLFSAEDWQKKLFLGAFFGAELSKPMTSNGYDFQMPSFSVSKLEALADNAIQLLEDFRTLLLSLGVETGNPALVEGYRYDGMDGPSVGYRLSILSNTDNLLRFLGRVGYLYNHEKQRLASLVTCFLTHVQAIRGERNQVRQQAVALKAAGVTAATIIGTLSSDVAGPSFIRHSIWQTRGGARLWRSTRFEEFAETFEEEKSGLVYDRMVSIESVPYEGLVHDVTIGDVNHNFVADGVVVSNCGMRLVRTNLRLDDVKPKIKELVDLLFRLVPTGVGVKGFVKLNQSQFEDVMRWGVKWCAENGYGWEDDVDKVEEGGFIKGADPSKVSRQASSRGINQLGTLGSGNHYCEVQVVDPARFFDREMGKKFGLVHDDQVVVMVHCGSRGFGHQVASDYLRVFDEAMKRYRITVRDRELACAPFSSKEGADYYGAMVCAANMAFANRQVIVQRIREAFTQVFHKDAEALDMQIIYDVCHNIAKVERHTVDGDGSSRDLLVHRKGATRSFGPGHQDIPPAYRALGQPVIIGGSMETGSYLLLGTNKAMQETFGSTAHGSGRTMSRTAAKKQVSGIELQRKMERHGIYVKAATMEGLAEEAGMAYKDISQVVETMHQAGISLKVAALRPIGNIKG
jgi:tRNA-splicing ligase RtcB (3'-phosphate/5'-hydroxy nucleic acid ligase)